MRKTTLLLSLLTCVVVATVSVRLGLRARLRSYQIERMHQAARKLHERGEVLKFEIDRLFAPESVRQRLLLQLAGSASTRIEI